MTPLVFTLLLISASAATSTATPPPISAVYAFGDSTIDTGNNNHLPTLFRADHSPYGVNFPTHLPTGRFSDGLLAADFLVAALGIKPLLPPYLTVQPLPSAAAAAEILTGVNFASSGSGLDQKTIALTSALDMGTQVAYFGEARAAMEAAFGKENASAVVEKAVFLVSVGTNDLVWSYVDSLLGSPGVTPEDYSDLLVRQLELHIRDLHSLGARKFAIVGIPPIGCLPIEATLGSLNPFRGHFLDRLCSSDQNNASMIYNSRLKRMLSGVGRNITSAKLVYLDAYNALMDMIRDPESYGFESTINGCCGTGVLEAGELCNLLDPICPNPSSYIFWDSFHPTQAAYSLLAKQFMKDISSLY